MTRADAWFDRLYERHHRQVLAYCLRRTSRSDVDDAVSETFAVAWRRRDEVPDVDRELPWLYGVARRVLSHQRRSSDRRRRLALRAEAIQDPPPPGPDTVVVQLAEYAQVRSAVAKLRPDDRDVLLLAAWEGLSHAEIGEVLDCSTDAATKRLARAKERLAKQYRTMTGTTTHRPPASAAEGGGSR